MEKILKKASHNFTNKVMAVELLVMMIPGVVYLFINNYIPISGLVIAFKRFNYQQGIWGYLGQ